MKRSNKESVYRMKIIQEKHYNKKEQAILDRYAAKTGKAYKKLYEDHRAGRTNSYAAEIGALRLSEAARRMGTTAAEAAEAIRAGFYKAAEAMKLIVEAAQEKARRERMGNAEKI